jgi:hypothetical protein
MKIQLDEGTTMIQAMSVPPGTVANDIYVYAESSSRIYDYSLANSVDEVRNSIDKYFLDDSTNTLYWRVITGFVESDGTFGWVDREAKGQKPFSRGGLSVTDYGGKSQFQLHIEVACPNSETDSTGAFCASQPIFSVPSMGCPEGEVMIAIDKCGQPCELIEGGCTAATTTVATTTTVSTTTAAAPNICSECTNEPTPFMIENARDCDTRQNTLQTKCNEAQWWVSGNYCELSCYNVGRGYEGSICCQSCKISGDSCSSNSECCSGVCNSVCA